MLTPGDLATAVRLRKLGIRMPVYCVQAAKRAGLPVALAASILMQETGGGRNEWGHDPTIFVGGYDARHGRHYGPNVTKAGYLAYRAQRGPTGRGGMQGVGPCQLTYYAFQDEADKKGGCWRPLVNMTVGFAHLAASIRRDGLRAGVEAYNGSGAAARAYADTVIAREQTFAWALKKTSASVHTKKIDGVVYYGLKKDVPLKKGQRLGYTPGRGYYARTPEAKKAA